MSGFERFHPAVLFLYYLFVLIFAMFSSHPMILFAIAAGGVFFYAMQSSIWETVKNLLYYFFFFLLLSAVNPLFSHDGETILFFMNDNPVTLEAIQYGAAIALMIIGVMFWCKAYQKILTTDKFLYLFGKMIPRLSLVLSMSIRFLPNLKSQIKCIHSAQKAMGMYAKDSAADRVLGSMRGLDSLLSWSIEHAVDTADAMKARGYGLPGRSDFSLFHFRKSDLALLLCMLLLGVLIMSSYLGGSFDFYYYPVRKNADMRAEAWIRYGEVLIFTLLPGLLEVKEKLQWKYWKSKI